MLVIACPDPYGASREHARDGGAAPARAAALARTDARGSAVSSAILYLAIVAIWAVVLVPRWLRPRSAAPHFVDQPVEPPAETDDAHLGQPATAESAEPAMDAPGASESPEADPVMGRGPARRSRAERRADVLRARRRMLATLIGLTVGAVSLAVTGLAASWVIIPPAVLLGFLVVLLREAARIDAERAFDARRLHRAAQAHQAAMSRAAEPEEVPASPQEAPAAAVAEAA